MVKNHGMHHSRAYRGSIDLSRFRDDEIPEVARKYREVLTGLKKYDGKIRDIEPKFIEKKGVSKGNLFFKYHGDDPRGCKVIIEKAIEDA